MEEFYDTLCIDEIGELEEIVWEAVEILKDKDKGEIIISYCDDDDDSDPLVEVLKEDNDIFICPSWDFCKRIKI